MIKQKKQVVVVVVVVVLVVVVVVVVAILAVEFAVAAVGPSSISHSDSSGSIGIGAQSTLGGQDVFAQKYMYDKFLKCRNFTWYLPENAQIFHDICTKKNFPKLGGGARAPHASRLLCLSVVVVVVTW